RPACRLPTSGRLADDQRHPAARGALRYRMFRRLADRSARSAAHFFFRFRGGFVSGGRYIAGLVVVRLSDCVQPFLKLAFVERRLAEWPALEPVWQREFRREQDVALGDVRPALEGGVRPR